MSRDGVNFTIAGDREPLLRPGMSGGYASRLIWVAAHPVVVDDEIWVYVGGRNVNHTGGVDPESKGGLWRSGVGLAKARLDGFVSLDSPLLSESAATELLAGWNGSDCLTKPLVFTGSRLRLNVDTGAAGSVLIEVIDAASSLPLRGYSLDDAVPMVANSVRLAPRELLTSFHTVPIVQFGGHLPYFPSF